MVRENMTEELKYQGLCTGGPYNGNFLAWPQKRYVIAIESDPPLQYVFDTDVLPRIGYSCYNFNLGHWIWQGDVAYPGG
jgi:hypothetical protein